MVALWEKANLEMKLRASPDGLTASLLIGSSWGARLSL